MESSYFIGRRLSGLPLIDRVHDRKRRHFDTKTLQQVNALLAKFPTPPTDEELIQYNVHSSGNSRGATGGFLRGLGEKFSFFAKN